uniref:Elongation factor 1-beta n=1 Tax=Acartia pacifica TaxID=335913 RepID=R9TI00_ACAPC|nr:elongation factor 1-beta [Acartia pacifica]
MFGDLKTPAGVKALDGYLAEHSYIEGYVPSQADTAVFQGLKGAPGSDSPHALRWYNHIKSFGDGMKQFPKSAKGSDAYTKGAAPAAADDDDDDVDLFGSDEEEDDEEKKRVTEERLAAYAAKKAKKPAVIAKTSVLLDVKPWDDETNMDEMLANVKSVEMDGLVWGASKLVPIGYGIKKLQVMCVVEDEKVSVDELMEKIEAFEDFVQSVDVSAMNKI